MDTARTRISYEKHVTCDARITSGREVAQGWPFRPRKKIFFLVSFANSCPDYPDQHIYSHFVPAHQPERIRVRNEYISASWCDPRTGTDVVFEPARMICYAIVKLESMIYSLIYKLWS